ncbi:hypothetical protein [Ancylobacter radicis]|uniref:DUF2892 domain-containing protein n=1 Tax=Ancylobacter radicis TaxID=2836179 RepID=A0ABS5R3I8_9HYPH|nr:hypothetical protein [Ancylobacter radicis]MBS9476228.1 hypothetical protein [Ancylobacter radicis]
MDRLFDALGIVGAVSVVVGCALIHPPSAFIVGGLLLMGAAILGARS